MKSKNILIVGTGSWGTALSTVLTTNKHRVYMYGVSEHQTESLNNGFNSQFFGELKILKPTLASIDLDSLLVNKIDFLVIASPSSVMENVLQNLSSKISKDVTIINSAKGLYIEQKSTFFDLIRKYFPENKVCSILGPSFAIDVIKNYPTSVNVVSNDIEVATDVKKIFNNKNFNCIPITDEIGSSIVSATKNALAILCGIFNFRKYSINTLSAVLTVAFKEIKEMIKLFGGDENTILELCGIGDIYLTCNSSKSRNYKFGEMIGEFGVAKTIKMNQNTVEGYNLMRSINIMLKNDHKTFPFFMQFHNYLSSKSDFKDLIKAVFKI